MKRYYFELTDRSYNDLVGFYSGWVQQGSGCQASKEVDGRKQYSISHPYRE